MASHLLEHLAGHERMKVGIGMRDRIMWVKLLERRCSSHSISIAERVPGNGG
jgi:hypothetical protein